MKPSLFRLLTVSLSVIAISILSSTVFAQGKGKGGGGGGNPPPPTSPFNYRIEYVDFHPGNNGGVVRDIAMVASGAGESLYIVGSSRLVSGQDRAFVYDRANNQFIDVPTLLGLNESIWVGSSCRAISSNGIVVGWLRDTNAGLHGYWLDLLAAVPTLNLLEDTFPEIVDGTPNYAIDVNSNGDILTKNEWIVNIRDVTSQQLPASFSYAEAINDLGDVIGAGVNSAIRYNIHIPNSLEVITGVYKGSTYAVIDINNVGEFCGYVSVPTRKNQSRTHAYRWGFGTNFDWLSDTNLATYSNSINDSGDVTGQRYGYSPDAFLHYKANGQTYLVKNLVNDDYLDAAGLANIYVTERDTSLATPAPIIVGNAVGASDGKIFILIPEELP